MASILVVDDDADARDALFRFLKSLGHQVKSAPNGREALDSILAEIPDLIVLDLLMPEMNGAGLLEVLRAYLRLQALPVIIWTAAETSPILERARQLKANAVLIKAKTTIDEIRQTIDCELYRAAN